MASDTFTPQVNPDNPDPRVACVLLLDTSQSMGFQLPGGVPIDELNKGLQTFQGDIREDPLARKRTEIMVISFGGGVYADPNFVEAQDFVAPTLTPSGNTPLAEALQTALDALEQQKKTYRDAGIEYYRPWLIVMTDGAPTDDPQAINDVVAKLEKLQRHHGVTVFPIGVGDQADMAFLNRLSSDRDGGALHDVSSFSTFFQWLSKSLEQVSNSSTHGADDQAAASRTEDVGQVALPDPSGWMKA